MLNTPTKAINKNEGFHVALLKYTGNSPLVQISVHTLVHILKESSLDVRK